MVLTPEPEAPGRARAAVAELRGRLAERAFDDLRTILSELVTNSVQHGPDGEIRLTVDVGLDGVVRGEVSDEGPSYAPPERNGGSLRGEGGYGLEIVEALSDSWGYRSGSSAVWFELGA